MEPHELIVCRDVSLGYEGQTVLSHLNLTIRDGDYLCIVGDNGSGKSTLLRGLLGLLAPQSGEFCGRRAGARSRGLSSPADPGPAGLSRHRAGGGSLRVPQPEGLRFSIPGPEVSGPDEPGKARCS